MEHPEVSGNLGIVRSVSSHILPCQGLWSTGVDYVSSIDRAQLLRAYSRGQSEGAHQKPEQRGAPCRDYCLMLQLQQYITQLRICLYFALQTFLFATGRAHEGMAIATANLLNLLLDQLKEVTRYRTTS
jgi:hypothetical protein